MSSWVLDQLVSCRHVGSVGACTYLYLLHFCAFLDIRSTLTSAEEGLADGEGWVVAMFLLSLQQPANLSYLSLTMHCDLLQKLMATIAATLSSLILSPVDHMCLELLKSRAWAGPVHGWLALPTQLLVSPIIWNVQVTNFWILNRIWLQEIFRARW